MDIDRVPPVSGVGQRSTPGHSSNPPPVSTERSLVPVASPSDREIRQTPFARPSPAFLAHLIATAQHAPQTRARSRAEPADAIAHYNSGPDINTPPQTWERLV